MTDNRLTAEQAIEKITGVTVEEFGLPIQKYTHGIDIRAELQKMAEMNMISPAEFYKASKMVFNSTAMTDRCKEDEYKKLS